MLRHCFRTLLLQRLPHARIFTAELAQVHLLAQTCYLDAFVLCYCFRTLLLQRLPHARVFISELAHAHQSAQAISSDNIPSTPCLGWKIAFQSRRGAGVCVCVSVCIVNITRCVVNIYGVLWLVPTVCVVYTYSVCCKHPQACCIDLQCVL